MDVRGPSKKSRTFFRQNCQKILTMSKFEFSELYQFDTQFNCQNCFKISHNLIDNDSHLNFQKIQKNKKIPGTYLVPGNNVLLFLSCATSSSANKVFLFSVDICPTTFLAF